MLWTFFGYEKEMRLMAESDKIFKVVEVRTSSP